MLIEQRVTVEAPLERVWDFFDDVEAVTRCFPGAEITEALGDDTYSGRMLAAVGPFKTAFAGEATVVRDGDTRSGTIDAHGRDAKGGSRARMRVDYQLVEAAAGTRIEVKADLTLSGPLAQFGRTGVINDVASQLTAQFASCLQSKLAAAPGSAGRPVEPSVTAPPDALSLFAILRRSLWSGLKRLLRRARSRTSVVK